MNTSQNPVPDEPTVQEIREKKPDQLLKWIQKKLTVPLDTDDEKKFLKAKIDGEVFLHSAGNEDFSFTMLHIPWSLKRVLAFAAQST
jgi:hypothetical protein